MNERRPNRVCWATIGALSVALLVTAGCGGSDGPPRYPVRGTVTYRGEPLPAGEIAFEPDAEKGNRGPAAYGRISGGRYALGRGEGTVGGPHRVRITGYEGEGSVESPFGRMLFSDYATTVDLPEESATQDFDVPANP
jgi:hypothetical protein